MVETPGFETVPSSKPTPVPERRNMSTSSTNLATTIIEESPQEIEKEALMSRSESTLPSSSSTIIFNQAKENSSSTSLINRNSPATPEIVEEDLVIPQELKNTINENLLLISIFPNHLQNH